MKSTIVRSLLVLAVLFAVFHFLPCRYEAFSFLVVPVFAHCDTMGGPVIQAAQKALETGDVKLVLIWVQKKDEEQIKEAFDKTLKVRKLSPEAKEMADMYFFETLVRIHRAGEGAPYTGIKPAGEVEPGIEMADTAVEKGSADELLAEVTGQVAAGIKERFDKVIESKKHMNESVDAGREYVENYVIFIHYVERLHTTASTNPSHHDEDEEGGHEEHHNH